MAGVPPARLAHLNVGPHSILFWPAHRRGPVVIKMYCLLILQLPPAAIELNLVIFSFSNWGCASACAHERFVQGRSSHYRKLVPNLTNLNVFITANSLK